MVFSSYIFLFAFLPLFLGTYYACPNKLKNLIILVFSLIFYAWGAISVIPFLLLSIFIDYYFIQKPGKINFIIPLALNIIFLCYYKYLNFFIEQFNFISPLDLPLTNIALPIGVSFFVFQKISYLADVYNTKVEPAKSLINYSLYVLLFPQLIAGPIVKYHLIEKQIKSRTHSSDNFFNGLVRFSTGLFKKVFIADMLAFTAVSVFSADTANIDAFYAWSGLLAYTLQLYFDFSGYSDMAVGLGLMCGFKIPENFNRPYLAHSITDFWRRWHMTLSSWMKEYLYVPLGGNRRSQTRTYINLSIVFILSGLWHGASWNFVLWGAFHGIFIVTDKFFWSNFVNKFNNKFIFIV
ncbi:UNVERIFIED_CONTAM: hypothetical protein GTU68_008467, partial [Idotea baltica]|nr:hypothetical protein [Idotea baltica]